MFLKILQGRKKRNLPDEQLTALYRDTGDMALLGELYGRYMEMIFAICFKYLKDEEESKDAVMQLFEKLAVELREHEVTNFKGWLHTVCRNHCLMQLRSAGRKFQTRQLSLDDTPKGDVEMEPAAHPEDKGALEARLDQMEKGIGQLPEAQQRCVRLFYLEKKCYKEIAEITGYDMKQVKSYLQNGKRNLKIFMEAQQHD